MVTEVSILIYYNVTDTYFKSNENSMEGYKKTNFLTLAAVSNFAYNCRYAYQKRINII